MQRIWAPNLLLCIGLGAICTVFYLFSYNSGYGYDALEYLVIGRSMAEGVPFYTYLPSKSPAIYYLVEWLYKSGIGFDHRSLAGVITAIFALTVAATYLIARRWFSDRAAVAIAGLTALAAFFMELNFLQPTALFYVCGLIAFDALLRFEKSRRQWLLFAAGAALGIGIVIKSSAAFYGLAAGHFLILTGTRDHLSFAWLVRCGLSLLAGVLLVLGIVFGYYFSVGSAHAFIDWTFVFPFAHYPSSATYLSKAYTKLLWVNVFILASAPLLFRQRTRTAFWEDRPAVLALLFGACAHLALLKTQASHYFFPGTPFLFMFAVSVYEKRLGGIEISKTLAIKTVAIGTAAAVAFVASITLYRPDAMQRLITFKDFSRQERTVRDFVTALVPRDRYLLVTGSELASTWTYWVSHRYPPPPFVNMDVKTIWMLRHQPTEVFKVLDDPQLLLVQFDPLQLQKPVLEDVFGNLPSDRDVMREYLSRIKLRFEPLQVVDSPATFWRRTSLGPSASAARAASR